MKFICGHGYHLHCVNRWPKTQNTKTLEVLTSGFGHGPIASPYGPRFQEHPNSVGSCPVCEAKCRRPPSLSLSLSLSVSLCLSLCLSLSLSLSLYEPPKEAVLVMPWLPAGGECWRGYAQRRGSGLEWSRRGDPQPMGKKAPACRPRPSSCIASTGSGAREGALLSLFATQKKCSGSHVGLISRVLQRRFPSIITKARGEKGRGPGPCRGQVKGLLCAALFLMLFCPGVHGQLGGLQC